MLEGGGRLAGAKSFASGAAIVERALVTAGVEGKPQLCLVPLDRVPLDHVPLAHVPLDRQERRIDSGSWRPLGMKASGSGTFRFDGIEFDVSALWEF